MSRRSDQIAGLLRGIIARFTVEIPPQTATGISITEVRLSPDLLYADVYVSAISGASAVAQVLLSRKGEIRKVIAKEINAYTVPILRFHVDTRGEEADALDTLIDSL